MRVAFELGCPGLLGFRDRVGKIWAEQQRELAWAGRVPLGRKADNEFHTLVSMGVLDHDLPCLQDPGVGGRPAPVPLWGLTAWLPGFAETTDMPGSGGKGLLSGWGVQPR
jgi:hypothetical protein